MNIWLKLLRNVTKLEKAYLECKGGAAMAGGVEVNVRLKLLNVSKLEKAYLECKGWAVMAGGVKMNVRLKVECEEWASRVDDVQQLLW